MPNLASRSTCTARQSSGSHVHKTHRHPISRLRARHRPTQPHSRRGPRHKIVRTDPPRRALRAGKHPAPRQSVQRRLVIDEIVIAESIRPTTQRRRRPRPPHHSHHRPPKPPPRHPTPAPNARQQPFLKMLQGTLLKVVERLARSLLEYAAHKRDALSAYVSIRQTAYW